MSILNKLLKRAESETSPSSPAVDLSDKPAIHPKDPPSAGVMPVQRPQQSARSGPPRSRQPLPEMARSEPPLPWGNGTAKLALFKGAAGENPGTPMPPTAGARLPAAPPPAPMPAKPIVTTGNQPQKPLAGLAPKMPAVKHASAFESFFGPEGHHSEALGRNYARYAGAAGALRRRVQGLQPMESTLAVCFVEVPYRRCQGRS